MYTTGLVAQQGEQTICLYMAGRAHAGENLAALLTQRDAGRDKPLVMSDALVSNAADEAALIRCHCLAHGRRKFSELEETFPEECTVVIEALKQVFDHEEAGASPAAHSHGTLGLPSTREWSHHGGTQGLAGAAVRGAQCRAQQQFEAKRVPTCSTIGRR